VPDLSVKYVGLELRNPILAASATPTWSLKSIKKCVENGAAGVVLKTLVSEAGAITRKWPCPRFTLLDVKKKEGLPTSFVLYSIEQSCHFTPSEYREFVKKVKQEVDVPVIGSIMGKPFETWAELAKVVEEGGADAVELNMACPHLSEAVRGMGTEVGADPKIASEVTKLVKENVGIPVIPKLTLLAGNRLPEVAKGVEKAGADAVTMLNRLVGLEIDVRTAKPIMHQSYAGFGGPWARIYTQYWISKVAPQIKIPISATSGVWTWEDVVKYIMVGATTVQTCTAVLIKGYSAFKEFVTGLENFMKEHGYDTIKEMKGIALKNITPLDQIDRDTLRKSYVIEENCTGCGLCVRVCKYDAVKMVNRKAKIDADACDGCGLCTQICPADAIFMKKYSGLH
jgi:dihydroorotate dehydrogenase subfamily 1